MMPQRPRSHHEVLALSQEELREQQQSQSQELDQELKEKEKSLREQMKDLEEDGVFSTAPKSPAVPTTKRDAGHRDAIVIGLANNDKQFQVGMMQAPCADPGYFCWGFLCPCGAAYT